VNIYIGPRGVDLDDALDFADDDDDIAAILRVAGDEWMITTPLDLYCAERKRGTEVRYLVAYDPAELLRKILTADDD